MATRRPTKRTSLRPQGQPEAGGRRRSPEPASAPAAPRPLAAPRTRRDSQEATRERPVRELPIKGILVGGIVAAAAALAILLVVLVLSFTPVFTISSLEVEPTEHVTAESLSRLAAIEPGTTLLSLDEAAVTSRLRKNPWVGEVSYSRLFPDKLKIEVQERKVDCLVAMGTGNVVWCLGQDNVWIEPIPVSVGEGDSLSSAALAKAQEMGALLITDLPVTVAPMAGSPATDAVISAVQTYRSEFSDALGAQVVSYSAASVDSISCTLRSGVEVSLGGPSSIREKESVIESVLTQHAGKVTYINVRVPSKPSYRMIDSDSVQAGSVG